MNRIAGMTLAASPMVSLVVLAREEDGPWRVLRAETDRDRAAQCDGRLPPLECPVILDATAFLQRSDHGQGPTDAEMLRVAGWDVRPPLWRNRNPRNPERDESEANRARLRQEGALMGGPGSGCYEAMLLAAWGATHETSAEPPANRFFRDGSAGLSAVQIAKITGAPVDAPSPARQHPDVADLVALCGRLARALQPLLQVAREVDGWMGRLVIGTELEHQRREVTGLTAAQIREAARAAFAAGVTVAIEYEAALDGAPVPSHLTGAEAPIPPSDECALDRASVIPRFPPDFPRAPATGMEQLAVFNPGPYCDAPHESLHLVCSLPPGHDWHQHIAACRPDRTILAIWVIHKLGCSARRLRVEQGAFAASIEEAQCTCGAAMSEPERLLLAIVQQYTHYIHPTSVTNNALARRYLVARGLLPEPRRLTLCCGCCDAPWADDHRCAIPCTRHPDHAQPTFAPRPEPNSTTDDGGTR